MEEEITLVRQGVDYDAAHAVKNWGNNVGIYISLHEFGHDNWNIYSKLERESNIDAISSFITGYCYRRSEKR